jgi:hypothetical protein
MQPEHPEGSEPSPLINCRERYPASPDECFRDVRSNEPGPTGNDMYSQAPSVLGLFQMSVCLRVSCKPNSVPRPEPGRQSFIWIPAFTRIRAAYPEARTSRPSTHRSASHFPIWPCSVWGLPSQSVTEQLVRSYRTFSPLPDESGGIFSVALSVPLGPPGYGAHRSVEFGLSSPLSEAIAHPPALQTSPI